MTWFHLTARARGGLPALAEHDAAKHLWTSLARRFPETAAAVLMHNHLHLITRGEDPGAARRALGAALSGLTRRRGPLAERSAGWDPVPEPREIPDLPQLRRQVRYVLLNPCRASLVRDPMTWLWSTHRDALGAAADPWFTADELAGHLGWPWSPDFAKRLHGYVSADPSASVEGTPLPVPTEAGPSVLYTLDHVAAAALAASREAPGALQRRKGPSRRLFLHFARRQGWTNAATLARALGVSREAVRRQLAQPEPPGLDAAAMCLGDARLRLAGAGRGTE